MPNASLNLHDGVRRPCSRRRAAPPAKPFVLILASAADPEQPFPFSHQLHLEKELVCTDCHESVERGPVASIPSVNTCMICHSQIATERPLIKQMAEMQAKGLDFAWQRVYDYPRESHVRFEHAPHIRAKVECSTCHGNQKQQTVARRMVDMDMGFCVNCHKQKQASNDCMTCHY